MGCKSSHAADVVENGIGHVADAVRGVGGPSASAIQAEGALVKQQGITNIKNRLGKGPPGGSKSAQGAKEALSKIIPSSKPKEKDGDKGEDDEDEDEEAEEDDEKKHDKKKPKSEKTKKEGSPSEKKSAGADDSKSKELHPQPLDDSSDSSVLPPDPLATRASSLYEAEKLDVAIRDQQRRLEYTELNLDSMQEMYEVTRGFADRQRIPHDWAPCVAKKHDEIETKLEQAEQDNLELRRVVRERGSSPTALIAMGGHGSFSKKREQVAQQMQKELADLDAAKASADGKLEELKKAVAEREAAVVALKAKIAQRKAELEAESRKPALQKTPSSLTPSASLSAGDLPPAVVKSFVEQLSHLAVCDNCPTSQKTLLLRKMCEYCGLLPSNVLAAAGKKPMVSDMSTIAFSGMPFGDSIACLVCLVLRHRGRAQAGGSPALPPITSISIGDCGMTDAGAKHLAVALNDLPSPVTLRALSLISNNFSVDAVIHLLGALISNPNITEFELDLTSNDLQRDGCSPGKSMELAQYMAALKSSKPHVRVEMEQSGGVPVGMRRTGSVVGR